MKCVAASLLVLNLLFWCAGHSDSVASLAFSNDGSLLATGGLDGLVYVWDADTGAEKHKLEGPGEAIEVRGSGSRWARGGASGKRGSSVRPLTLFMPPLPAAAPLLGVCLAGELTFVLCFMFPSG